MYSPGDGASQPNRSAAVRSTYTGQASSWYMSTVGPHSASRTSNSPVSVGGYTTVTLKVLFLAFSTFFCSAFLSTAGVLKVRTMGHADVVRIFCACFAAMLVVLWWSMAIKMSPTATSDMCACSPFNTLSTIVWLSKRLSNDTPMGPLRKRTEYTKGRPALRLLVLA